MIGDLNNPYSMAHLDPSWRLRKHITELNKALRGCVQHPNGMSGLLIKSLNLDKQILQAELKDRRQGKCHHVWAHRNATIHNRLVTSTWCRKCNFVPAEAAARATLNSQ